MLQRTAAPAGQSDGAYKYKLSATLAADRAFPAAVAEHWSLAVFDAHHPMNARIFLSAVVAVLFFCGGCGAPPAQQTVDRVRSEVATILKKDAARIDVAKPLIAQGADELDIVEIVMAVEEAFEVAIPDSAIGENVGEASKTLTVQKLAEIVSEQRKTK
jgi:acyl carrier protein